MNNFLPWFIIKHLLVSLVFYGHRLCTVACQSVPVLLRVQVHEGFDKG